MGTTTSKQQHNKNNKQQYRNTAQLSNLILQQQNNTNNNNHNNNNSSMKKNKYYEETNQIIINQQQSRRYSQNNTSNTNNNNNNTSSRQSASPINFCCGLDLPNSSKKNKQRNKLTWQQNVLIFCQKYKNKLDWIDEIIKIVKSKDINLQKYKKQFNDIRYMQKQPSNMQKTIKLTPNQLYKFKNNLRKSVLLSSQQVQQQSNILNNNNNNNSNNNNRQISKISSLIQPNTTLRKSYNLKSDIYLQQFTNNPYTSTTSLINRTSYKTNRNNKNSFINNNGNINMNIRQSLKKQSLPNNNIHSNINSNNNTTTNNPNTNTHIINPKINIRQSVISLVDDTMTSMFKGQQQQISKLNQYSLQIFIKFTIMLQKHLTSQDHKIRQIIKVFYNCMEKKYEIGHHYYNFHEDGINNGGNTNMNINNNKMNSNTNNNNKKNNKSNKSDKSSQIQNQLTILDFQTLIQNIKIFISLLTQIVQDYYNTKSLSSSSTTNQSDVYSSFSSSQPPKSKPSQSFTSTPQSPYSQSINNINATHLITNSQNILTIITSILFKDEKFNNFLFAIIKQFNKQKDQHVNIIYEKLHGKQPSYFSINNQYCLNFNTLKKFMDQKSSVQSNVYIQNLVPEELQSNQQKPYYKCSQSLMKLGKSKTPINKMKAILQCAQKITSSIIQFYNINKIILKNEMIDADQVLSIFCYILSINKIDNIFSHLFMIQHFATQHQKISITGYYYSVISCAVQQNFGQGSQRHLQYMDQQDRRLKQKQQMQQQIMKAKNKLKQKSSKSKSNERKLQQIQKSMKNQCNSLLKDLIKQKQSIEFRNIKEKQDKQQKEKVLGQQEQKQNVRNSNNKSLLNIIQNRQKQQQLQQKQKTIVNKNQRQQIKNQRNELNDQIKQIKQTEIQIQINVNKNNNEESKQLQKQI